MTAADLQKAFETEFAELIKKGLTFDIMTFPESGRSGVLKPMHGDNIPNVDRDKILVWYPFIFDSRKLPETFKDFKIEALRSHDTFPEEFRLDEEGLMTSQECWSEKRIIAYAQEHALEICEELNDYSLTFEEICDIVAGGSLEELKKNNAAYNDLGDDEFEDDDWEDEEE